MKAAPGSSGGSGSVQAAAAVLVVRAGARNAVRGLSIIRGATVSVVDLGGLLDPRRWSPSTHFVTIRAGARRACSPSGMPEGRTLVQHELTSTVFGMPAEAIRVGAAERVLGVGEVAPELIELAACNGWRKK